MARLECRPCRACCRLRTAGSREARPIIDHDVRELMLGWRIRHLGPQWRRPRHVAQDVGQLARVKGMKARVIRGRIAMVPKVEEGRLADRGLLSNEPFR